MDNFMFLIILIYEKIVPGQIFSIRRKFYDPNFISMNLCMENDMLRNIGTLASMWLYNAVVVFQFRMIFALSYLGCFALNN